MFDWNDEELVNIIWGEARESDDHIVPYPRGSEEKPLVTFGDHSKKQWNQEASSVKLADQKTSGAKTDFSGSKLESSSQSNTNERLSAPGFDMDSWPGGNGQDSMDIEVSNVLTELPNLDSERADTSRLDNDSELFENEPEDKVRGGFLDYSWVNIGTFDDLDRIFRNDDPIFGCESLGNADELWSSSADVISSPAKSFPISVGCPSSGLRVLRNTSDQYEIKTEFIQDEDQTLTPGYGRMNDPNSHVPKNVDPSKDEVAAKGCHTLVDLVVECAGGKSKPLPKKTDTEMIGKTEALNSHTASENSATQNNEVVKVNGQRKLLKCRKKEEEGERKLSEDLCGALSPTANQFQQFGNQFATSAIQTFPSSVLSPQGQPGGPESLRYLQTSHPYLPAGYGNMTHHHSVMPMLPHVHSERDKHQPVLAGYGFSPGSPTHVTTLKKFSDVPSRPMTMTPQEKIEKLRRRQQMQAMLAIQEQQQQFGHQVTCPDHSDARKCLQGNQNQDTEDSSIDVEENIKIPTSLEPNSPVEQDDSNTISMVIDECSLEERILDQLQDVIGKLDIRIRLCIRDSLFRLAQSAMQRHIASDTSSTSNSRNENEAIAKEETDSHNRSTRKMDAETETNPIDRTVAHFLFNRPSESSTRPVKDGEIPESPVSTKLLCEPKTEGFMNLPGGCLYDNSTDKQSVSHPPCTVAEPQHVDQFQSNGYINAPENASNDEPEHGGMMEVDTSK